VSRLNRLFRSGPDLNHVNILMFNATGRGGIARTVNNLANHLSAGRTIEIFSLFRDRNAPQFPIESRVRVHWLIDNRVHDDRGGRPRRNREAPAEDQQLDKAPSALENDKLMSAYTDRVLERTLPTLRPGILITTRPLLHMAALKWAPEHQVLVAQDHLNFETRMRNPYVHAMFDEVVPGVDAFVTLTDGDRDDYRRQYPTANVLRIPNASPYVRGKKSTVDSKIVLAAGRLTLAKGFDRLIDAYAPLISEFPDWQLHIYGKGNLDANLQRQIDALGVGDHVVLKGYTLEFDEVLAGASMFAMSSLSEGFPMVLLEAMSHGLPLVSFDCPRGPAEIIRDGENGRLVDDGDIPGFTQALRGLMGDDDLRRRMGTTAYGDAELYEAEGVTAMWEDAFTSAATRYRARQ
jgi:glycosyltransferase involved in cell wall biosynthesis